MTHSESDYGAAPKVEMPLGQPVTVVVPDFASKRWLEVFRRSRVEPLYAICRTQVDVRFEAPSQTVAARMPGYRSV